MTKRAVPKARRCQNTVVTRMNKVQAFFNELLEREEIEISPFHKLGRKRKASMMREEYDASIKDNVFYPLYQYGSSKICRSTHEDMLNKVQINMYVSGLHEVGIKAIHRYTMNELGDLFALMCVAFGQSLYKVDKDLNIIEEN